MTDFLNQPGPTVALGAFPAQPARGGAREADLPTLGARYARFLALALVCVGAAAALGWMPTRRLVGEAGTTALIAALGVALAASLVGTLPIVMARRRSPLEAMPAQLGAMALRLVAVLVFSVAIGLGFGLALQPFLIWVVLAHAVLLVPDTLFARSFVNSPRSVPRPAPRDTAPSETP